MNIPTGDWCVVQRLASDIKSKGDIIYTNITKETAQYIVAGLKDSHYYNYWAMHRKTYDTPFWDEDYKPWHYSTT